MIGARMVVVALLCGSGGCALEAASSDVGRFSLSWTLQSAAGDPLECSQAQVAVVEVKSTPVGGSAYVDRFECLEGGGDTLPLPAGDYRVSLTAYGDSDQILGTSEVISEKLPEGGALVILGDIAIPISAGIL